MRTGFFRFTITLLSLASLLCQVGCGKQPAGDGHPPASNKLRVAMVSDVGAIDDRAFNAAAWAGMQRAAKDLGCDAKLLESHEQADYRTNLSNLAEAKYDLVVALGYMMEEAMAKASADYPNTKFAIVDGNAPNLPNALALKFREQEGSFLAGYLAARMTKKHAIGFIGGMDVPVLRRFEAGYRAGARTADPNIRVFAKYMQSFSDPTTGNSMAEQMLADVDIIYAAAGKSGLGILKACADHGEGYYGIGTDADQDSIHPGRVLTSMMKRVDNAVYASVKAMKDGTWKPGELSLGLKEGGVHLSPMTYTKKDVPQDVLSKVDTLSKMIVDGKVVVPKTIEEEQSFNPPVLK